MSINKNFQRSKTLLLETNHNVAVLRFWTFKNKHKICFNFIKAQRLCIGFPKRASIYMQMSFRFAFLVASIKFHSKAFFFLHFLMVVPSQLN